MDKKEYIDRSELIKVIGTDTAPRGSRTGTQGLKGSRERAKIPKELCRHIIEICEDYICGMQ